MSPERPENLNEQQREYWDARQIVVAKYGAIFDPIEEFTEALAESVDQEFGGHSSDELCLLWRDLFVALGSVEVSGSTEGASE